MSGQYKAQRTGLTEGSLLYNDWLKRFGLYRSDTEDEFINWLYSTSGWYDTNIKGHDFDIDTKAVKESGVYQDFKREYLESLKDCNKLNVLVHSSHHLRGRSKFDDFFRELNSGLNKWYWKDIPYLKSLITPKTLVVNSLAPLIEDKYEVYGYQTPQTHLNSGPDKHAFETLKRVESGVKDLVKKKDIDFVFVSFGAYGCLLVDRLVKAGISSATIGSGVYDLFPLQNIPGEYIPRDYLKIEDGRYWKVGDTNQR